MDIIVAKVNTNLKLLMELNFRPKRKLINFLIRCQISLFPLYKN